MKVTCLIVDDEPIARQIMERYCAVLPQRQVLASCNNALEAKRLLESRPVDLLFLDIYMPVLDGLVGTARATTATCSCSGTRFSARPKSPGSTPGNTDWNITRKTPGSPRYFIRW